MQDEHGVLYFGDKNVVLEYDGVLWRKILVSDTTYVRGLVLDPATNTLFVGAVDELGFFRHGPGREKTFQSLLDRLPPDARGFHDIRRCYRTSTGIFFVADAQVMRWRDERFTVWKLPNASRLQSHLVAGQLFVQHPGPGLLRFDPGTDTFVPVSGDPRFHESTVTLLLPRSPDAPTAAPTEAPAELFVGTREHGLWTLPMNADHTAAGPPVPLPTAVDALLRSKRLRRGTRLADGALALALESAGLLVLPSAEELDALLELSRRGDILKVKRQLAALRVAEAGRYAPFVHTLEPFVAGYQMHRLRDALARFQTHHANGNHP